MSNYLNFKTDADGYRGGDSGCRTASKYLGRQSSCSQCLFLKCIYDLPRQKRSSLAQQKRDEIIKLSKDGVKPKELATVFSINARTIWRVVHGRR